MPGKTAAHAVTIGLRHAASMRPQRNAGENPDRPEVHEHVLGASMRPQRNAGENEVLQDHDAGGGYASMRPQRNAGENCPSRAGRAWRRGGFNEAPAKCRGKQGRHQARRDRRRASMRPQRNAGENGWPGDPHRRRMPRFNEAPAKCRGKRARPHVELDATAELQ